MSITQPEKTRPRTFQLGTSTPLVENLESVAENLLPFCSCPQILQEIEIKVSRVFNLMEKISRQSNIQAVAWILLGALSHL